MLAHSSRILSLSVIELVVSCILSLSIMAVKSNFTEPRTRVVCTTDDNLRCHGCPSVALLHNTERVNVAVTFIPTCIPQVPSQNLGRCVDSMEMFCGMPRYRLVNAEEVPYKSRHIPFLIFRLVSVHAMRRVKLLESYQLILSDNLDSHLKSSLQNQGSSIDGDSLFEGTLLSNSTVSHPTISQSCFFLHISRSIAHIILPQVSFDSS